MGDLQAECGWSLQRPGEGGPPGPSCLPDGARFPPLSHIEGRPAESHRKLEACVREARCRDNGDILSPLARLAALSALCCGGHVGL